MPEENPSKTPENMRFLKCILFSSLCAMTVIVFLFVLAHFAMIGLNLPLKAVEPIVIAISVMGGFTGGYAASSMWKKKGMLLGFICGAVIFVVMLISNLSYGNEISLLALIKFFLITISSSIGGILGVNKRQKRKKY